MMKSFLELTTPAISGRHLDMVEKVETIAVWSEVPEYQTENK